MFGGNVCQLCLVFMTVTHLTSRQVFGIFIEVINVGAERLEVRDDKLLPEGLGEQNDVALDTSRTGDDPKHSGLCCESRSGLWVGEFRPHRLSSRLCG